MRVTLPMLELEAQLTEQLLTTARGWRWWRDLEPARKPHQPGHLAIHEPTGVGLAIYTRPRRLGPSETPTPMPLPTGVLPVVWYPKLRPQVAAWLTHQLGLPPGHITPRSTHP